MRDQKFVTTKLVKKVKKILYITTLGRTINAFLVPHIEKLLKGRKHR